MAFDFDTPVDRRASDSDKWDRYGGRDVLPMWLADMDFRSPPVIVEALRRRVDHGVFGYVHSADEHYAVVQAMLQREYGWTVDRHWIVWLPGVMVGMNAARRTVVEDGQECLTSTPIYPPFLWTPATGGPHLLTAPLQQAGQRWTIDFDRLEAAITPRTRLYLHCNPQNPTGRAFTRDELTRLAALCQKHNLIIAADEIHCGLVLDADRRHVPIAALDGDVAARTLTFMAPSKTFNVPGLCCALAIVPDPDLRKRFRVQLQAIGYEDSIMGLTAALAAYRDGEPWRQELLAYLRGNRDLVEREIATIPGLAVNHPEATYLAWIDARSLGRDDPGAFFEEHGVGLGEGRAFGLSGFVRLTFACPRATLLEGLARIRRAMASRA